jgi:ABC-type glycerol-3-phosphate transport system substrate-binding protein
MSLQRSSLPPLSRRRFLQGSMLLTAGAALAACTPVPGASTTSSAPAAPAAEGVDWLAAEDISNMPETTIRYWYYETPERTELGKKQVEQFHQLFPNITVDGRTAPPAVDNEMLVAFIKAGTNSHVHQSVCNEDTWYITRDLLLPLEDLPGYAEVSARMNPNLNYTWSDGHAYAISWYSGPWVMYYNKKLVEAAGLDAANPPKTHSEFLQWAETLTKDSQFFLALSAGEEWWRWQFTTYPFYIAATGSNQLHSEDGKMAVFNKPEAVAVYELINTLFANGYNPREAFETNPFFSGQVAAALSAAFMVPNAKRNAPPDFEMVVGPVPKPDNATVEGFPTYNFVREFVLMREQEKQGEEADRINRAAWEFMKFLLSEEQLAADFAVSGDFPPVKDLTTNPAYAAAFDALGPVAREVATYADNSYIYDMNTHLESESMGVLTKSYLEMIFQKKTPAEALQWAEEEVNKLLAAG